MKIKFNLFKLTTAIIIVGSILMNALLIFDYVYNSENRHLTLTLFVVLLFITSVLPAYFMGRNRSLEK